MGVGGRFELISLGCLLGDIGPVMSALYDCTACVAVGRSVGGLASPTFGRCSCDVLGMGVKRNFVSDELGVWRGVVLAELGVTGWFWGVVGGLNFGDDWKGDGVWGRVCGWAWPGGDIRAGVMGRSLEGA